MSAIHVHVVALYDGDIEFGNIEGDCYNGGGREATYGRGEGDGGAEGEFEGDV